MEYEYEKYKKIVFKLAHKYNKINELDFEELVAEGNEAFVVASQKFNPDLDIRFSTFLFSCVNNKMFNFLLKQNKNKFNVELDIMKDGKDHYRIMLWAKSLSKESQYILNAIWKKPYDIFKFSKNNKITKSSVKKFLRAEKWEFPVILNCFDEIKNNLKYI